MNYRTFMVLLLLALPVQLDRSIRETSLGAVEVLTATLSAMVIALIWAFIAKWVRIKFTPNLTESYVTKIQAVFAVIGILLTINVFINPKENSEAKKLSAVDEASLIVDLVVLLEKDCREASPSNTTVCESVGDKVSDCIGGYRKPKDELNMALATCKEKLSKEFGK